MISGRSLRDLPSIRSDEGRNRPSSSLRLSPNENVRSSAFVRSVGSLSRETLLPSLRPPVLRPKSPSDIFGDSQLRWLSAGAFGSCLSLFPVPVRRRPRRTKSEALCPSESSDQGEALASPWTPTTKGARACEAGGTEGQRPKAEGFGAGPKGPTVFRWGAPGEA